MIVFSRSVHIPQLSHLSDNGIAHADAVVDTGGPTSDSTDCSDTAGGASS